MTLQVKEKFRYFFQGVRGSSISSGAILVDDITLTEALCPNAVWQIHNFSGVLATTPPGSPIRSKCFYNSEGHSFGISVYPNGKDSAYPDYVGMTLHLCSGENDAVMQWPAKNRQATVVAMDQDPDVKLRMSSTRSFTTGRSRPLKKFWFYFPRFGDFYLTSEQWRWMEFYLWWSWHWKNILKKKTFFPDTVSKHCQNTERNCELNRHSVSTHQYVEFRNV